VTPEQKAHFHDQGFLVLREAVKEQAVKSVKARVLQELKKQGVWSGGRALSSRMKGLPPFQQIAVLGRSIHHPALKDKLLSQSLVSGIHELAGARLVPEQDAKLLLSLPRQGAWTLEGLNWHRDIAQSKVRRLPGVQAFILIDDVSPNGGATLALPGSHRITSYRSLSPAANREVSVDGRRLPILEMSGRAGDVYLMDMRLIHTPSVNATKNVRMMATIRYFLT
jgi:hypothetical protein